MPVFVNRTEIEASVKSVIAATGEDYPIAVGTPVVVAVGSIAVDF